MPAVLQAGSSSQRYGREIEIGMPAALPAAALEQIAGSASGEGCRAPRQDLGALLDEQLSKS